MADKKTVINFQRTWSKYEYVDKPPVAPKQLKKEQSSDMPERDMENYSELEKSRLSFPVPIPKVLAGNFEIKELEKTSAAGNIEQIQALFPNCFGQPSVEFVPSEGSGQTLHKPLNIGCVLSGGQAAGGHNCICGLFDYVEQHAPGSKIFGFIGGPKGVMTGKYRILDSTFVDKYRNTGGFDMLTAGRDKIESEEQFAAARSVAEANKLDGLVVIGGDDSNTNAAMLAENFLKNGMNCKVLGLPKTIDGDLKNEYVETSFGFDTAAKVYAECVGNIQTDCMSTKKYYHFIRLMGREASHLTLEVALQTRPNMTFIGEEVRAKKLSLAQITERIADMIEARAKDGKNYGVVVIPEGLIDFVDEVSAVIAQINEVLASGASPEQVAQKLSTETRAVFEYLPTQIQAQLLLDRDPHGNVQVAKIESERLFALLAEKELERRTALGSFKGKFAVQTHYFGYEGRCTPPTDFDCQYCYVLGLTAGSLIGNGKTAMMASLRGLYKPVEDWKVCGMPLTHMMNVERRKGKDKPVIRKALVELEGAPFKAFCAFRDRWMTEDCYRNPGPIQYSCGIDEATFTLRCEQQGAEATQPAIAAPGKLCSERTSFKPAVPAVFREEPGAWELAAGEVPAGQALIQQGLVHTGRQPILEFRQGHGQREKKDLRLGLVFSGRQSPGGHNIIAGVHKFLKSHAGPKSVLYGFVDGTKGLFAGKTKEITAEEVERYVNQGGFDMLGRTADVIRGAEHIEDVANVCNKLDLDGLIVVGGTISMCDAGILAERLAEKKVKAQVIGIPCSIDGDLKSEFVEASVGYDTACRVYSSLIGNLQTDAASARKYYYFIRLMGREPSQIVLECGMQTQPNVVLIGEEIEASRKTLHDIVVDLADMVDMRAEAGKNFGVILIPEGLVEYIPELRTLLNEISDLYAKGATAAELDKKLSPWAAAMLSSLPESIRKEMLLEQENSTGKSQLNQIETERLLAELVASEMARRTAECGSKAKFSPVCFYLGYQARSSLPSNFDCTLAYSMGCTAAALVAEERNATGYMAAVQGLTGPPEEWRCSAVPISSMLVTGRRAGQVVAMLPPSCVDLTSSAFRAYMERRKDWQLSDCYSNPGPLQFRGPTADALGKCLVADCAEQEDKRRQFETLLKLMHDEVLSGKVLPSVLDAAVTGLSNLADMLTVVRRAEFLARGGDMARKARHMAHGVAAMKNEELMQLPDN